MSDSMLEIINDIRHSADVDSYTNFQRKFLWSIAERLESEATQAPASGEVEPVAFAISDTKGKVRPLSAFYVHEKLADKHIEGHEQEFKLHKVPLYTHPQSAQTGVRESDLIDHIDLMADEFKRIRALNPCPEIIDLCERALRVTEQNVPVVKRASDLENVVSRLLWENSDLKEQLRATPQPEGGWVKCSDRLPTDDERDCEGNVWAFVVKHGEVMTTFPSVVRDFYYSDKITHWMPTGLERPRPPKEGA